METVLQVTAAFLLGPLLIRRGYRTPGMPGWERVAWVWIGTAVTLASLEALGRPRSETRLLDGAPVFVAP